MELRRVPPETTDVITHVSDGNARPVRRSRPRPEPEVRPKRERVRRERVKEDFDYEDDDFESPRGRGRSREDLIFGVLPGSTLGIIILVAMFIITVIFGIKELGMSVPVFLMVLVFCTVMGILLVGAPVFVPVLVSALLLIVGAVTSLFPAVALGVAMLLSARLVLKGD